MSYVTVYEITRESIPLWIPFCLVIFGLLGTILHLLTRHAGPLAVPFRCFLLLFASLWLTFAVGNLLDHRHDVQNYRNGRYRVVEGRVENYAWKAKTECFTVRGVTFCHGTANQVGWDPPFRLGPLSWPVGLAQNGLPVRVAYSDEPIPFENGYISPTILRLEVARSIR